MIQKTIRAWGGTEFSTSEGAEQQTEWNDRTVYSVDGYNSIAELGANQAPMKVKTDYITITQSVNLDTIESDTSTNNAKLTYPAGDATKVGWLSVTQAVDLDAMETKLATIETSATADQTDAEIRTAVEAATDSNVFTDTDHTQLATNKTNADASKVKTDFITITQAVNLDTVESDTATNNAKVTYDDSAQVATNKTNADASKVITDFITVTQAVDLDTMESGIATNVSDISDRDLLFKTIVTSAGNYTTNAKDADTKKTVYMTSGTTLTLDKTSLTVDFQQQLFNSTGGAVTVSSSDTTEGGVTSIPDAGFCYYTLINATTWLVSSTSAAGGGDALVANPLSQFAATTSAQLLGVLSDETGTGLAVFGTSPTLITPALGTPSSLVGTNITGTAASLTVGATTGVEAGADVTDTTNVTAAGALMDSEVTNLAQVKAFDTTDYTLAADSVANDTAIELDNHGGDRYVASANTGTTYTFSGAVVGGWAKILVQTTTSHPTVTSATLETGAAWVGTTDFYMVIYTDDGTNVKYYFIEK